MPVDLDTANLSLWDQIFAGRSWGRYPPEELVRFVARNFARHQPRSAIWALEIGCGPGANLWFLANEGYSVAGIDGSPTAIEQAYARIARELPDYPRERADLRVGNFTSLPWPDGHFDFVFDNEALSANRIDVVRAAIAESHRVLKPGGKFFAKLFGPETTDILTGELLEPGTTRNAASGPLQDIGVLHAFTREELRALFADFADLAVDFSRRSEFNGRWEVFEWVVTCVKR
jgi:SAM-dependent methyltransferase